MCFSTSSAWTVKAHSLQQVLYNAPLNHQRQMVFTGTFPRINVRRYNAHQLLQFCQKHSGCQNRGKMDHIKSAVPDMQYSVSSGINISPWTAAKLIKIIQDPLPAATPVWPLLWCPEGERSHKKTSGQANHNAWEGNRVRESPRKLQR